MKDATFFLPVRRESNRHGLIVLDGNRTTPLDDWLKTTGGKVTWAQLIGPMTPNGVTHAAEGHLHIVLEVSP